MVSRNEVWKTEGVSTFSLGVLVRGHGIHNGSNTIIAKSLQYRKAALDTGYLIGVPDTIWEICRV